jgi:hypothetical protein
MDEAEHDEILRTAFENIAKRDDDAAELAERRARNLAYVAPREQYERRTRPAGRERGLDTDFASMIAAAITIEREYWRSVLPELIAAERADADAKITKLEAQISTLETRALDPGVAEALGNDARKLKAEIATLQNCISDLRATVANEAQRGVELPTFRYPRDLN